MTPTRGRSRLDSVAIARATDWAGKRAGRHDLVGEREQRVGGGAESRVEVVGLGIQHPLPLRAAAPSTSRREAGGATAWCPRSSPRLGVGRRGATRR